MEDRTIFVEQGKKAVLLFHAYTSTPNDMLALAREFERHNFTVYAPTLSGHGHEDPDVLLEYGMSDWLEDGVSAYQELVDKGYEDIYPFGLSLGGLVALNLIIDHQPDFGGVFSSPVMAYPDHHLPENFFKWYKMLKTKLGDSKEEIQKAATNQAPRLDQVTDEIWRTVREHLMPRYDQIQTRMFIGQAGQDEMIDYRQAEAFAKELTHAQDVVYKLYPEAPHAITTGRVGKELRQDLLDFIDSN